VFTSHKGVASVWLFYYPYQLPSSCSVTRDRIRWLWFVWNRPRPGICLDGLWKVVGGFRTAASPRDGVTPLHHQTSSVFCIITRTERGPDGSRNTPATLSGRQGVTSGSVATRLPWHVDVARTAQENVPESAVRSWVRIHRRSPLSTENSPTRG
jgi:hypothetical protein